MNTRNILRITKQWLAVVLVVAPLQQVGIAYAMATLDEQLLRVAGSGDLALV